MAYTVPGGAYPIYTYLINKKKNIKMNIGMGSWENILPDNQESFKISDILIDHKIENKYYLKYMIDQIRITSTVEEFAKHVEKICKWCGEDDIICVPHTYEHFDYILTASLVEGEAIGHANHYLWTMRVKWNHLMSKWRVWKLTHFKQKRSAKRQNFILEGTAQQYSDTEGEQR